MTLSDKSQISAHILAIEVERLKTQLETLAAQHDKTLREMGAMARLVDEAEQKTQEALTLHHHQYLRAESLNTEITALRNSTSWRITKPLRRLMQTLRKP